MAPELWILAVVVSAIALVAVPAIVRGSLLPRELELETVQDAALTDAQRRYFQRLDARLATIGYAPIANFVATNLQGANLTRVFRSDYDPAVLGASSMRGVNFVDETKQASENYGEWVTKYEDGTSLNTLNASVSDVFDRMPHQVRQRYPGVADLTRLKALHDRAAEGLRQRQPRFAHGRDVVAEWKDHHRRWCQFQETRGLLRQDTTADGYRVTQRTAWRGVLNFLNPLADNFSVPRLLLGLIGGAALPSAWLWLSSDPAFLARLRETVGRVPGLEFALALVAFALAGAIVGWLFEGKSFVWGLLLGYVPLRLHGSLLGEGMLLLLVMGFVADRVSWWRSRARAVV